MLRFGPYTISLAQRILLVDGVRVPLAPKVFDTLLVLAEANGRIVSKDELLATVWRGTFVEESSVFRNISALRKLFAEHAPGQNLIETISKRGYRLRPSVQFIPEQQNSAVATQTDFQHSPSVRASNVVVPADRNVSSLPGTNNLQAYDLYVRATVEYSKARSFKQSQRAIELMHGAMRLDPGFALPYTAIARICAHRHSFDEAREYALRALAIDSSLSEAHEVYGLTLFNDSWHFPAAEREFIRAVQLDPSNAWAHVAYAYYLAASGRKEEANHQAALARMCDPFETWFIALQALVYGRNREFEMAIMTASAALEQDPTQLPTVRFLRDLLVQLGRFDEYFAISRRTNALSSVDLDNQERAYERDGARGLYRFLLENLYCLEPKANSLLELTRTDLDKAALLCLLDETDAALDALERALQNGLPQLLLIRSQPAFDVLKGHSRYDAIVRRINLPVGDCSA